MTPEGIAVWYPSHTGKDEFSWGCHGILVCQVQDVGLYSVTPEASLQVFIKGGKILQSKGGTETR